MQHLAGVHGAWRLGVLVHEMREEFLIQRAPVDANADGLFVFECQFDDGGKLRIALGLEADISRIDAVFAERLGASRVIGQQLVADIVKIANQRNTHAHFHQAIANMRHGCRSLVAIHGDAHDLGTREGKGRDLFGRRLDIGGIRIGHGLHHNRRCPADLDATDIDRCGIPAC